MALEKSPALRALRAQVGEGQAQVDAATSLSNPELRVGNFRSDRLLRKVEADAFEDFSIGLRWSPPNLGAQAARRAEAERRVEQTEADLEQARRELVAKVRALHASAISYQAQVEHARTAVALRGELKKLVGRRLEQQAATLLDQSLADLDQLDALAALQEVESRLRQTLHDLRDELCLSAGTPLELSPADAPHCAAPTGDLATLLANAKSTSPKLRGFRARVEEVEAEKTRMWLELVPWFDFIQLSYVLGGRDDPDYVAARLSIPLPLLDWNRPELRSLGSRRQRIEAEQQAADQELESQIRRTVEELADQAALVERYHEAEPVLDKGLALLRRALEAGQADLVQMALVQNRTLGARRAQLRVLLQCQLTRIDLDRLIADDWRKP
ncbi:MAG: TolC family protein [Deltaproteobacteria bacterium]|nr:TolC family protein [Deltaproteobacteria bacterium]